MSSTLKAKPVTLKEANEFVKARHRHHKPTVGHRFSVGATLDGKLVGVAIVGRPVARKTNQYYVAEVARLCTDRTPNACSFLYAKAASAAKSLGYWYIQTFILDEEPGTTLRAANWTLLGDTSGRSWSVPSRHRDDQHPLFPKQKWGKLLNTPLEEVPF